MFATGVEGFVEFFGDFLERNPQRHIEIVRGWEDGRYVFVQAFQSLQGGAVRWVTTDFFDTDDEGKIIEHWDVIAPYCAKTPSGHTSVDGPTEVVDIDKTDQNKALVRAAIENLLMRGGDASEPHRYIHPDKYIQHNAEVPDGLPAFADKLNAPDRKLWYERIVLVVGCGNFVSTLCEASWGEQRYAQVDIFRLEDGRIVEHWDNVEKCPPPDELVNSGKF